MKHLKTPKRNSIKHMAMISLMVPLLLVILNTQSVAQESPENIEVIDLEGLPQASPIVDDYEPLIDNVPNDQISDIEQPSEPSQSQLSSPEPSSAELTPMNDEELFFDAEALVPESQMSRGAPNKLNPVAQPASSLIIITQDADGKSMQAQLIAAQRAMSLGRHQSAIEIYNTILSKNKNDVNALLGQAIAYQHLGQDEFAVQSYERVLQHKPNNIEAQLNMQGIIGQKYPAVALKNLMDLREKNPNNVGIVAQIAVAHANLDQYDSAIQSLGIAASMEPQNPTHIFNMAVIADRAGAKKEAIQYYEEALKLDTLYGNGSTIPREAIFQRLASLR